MIPAIMRSIIAVVESHGMLVCQWHGLTKTIVGLNKKKRQWTVTVGEDVLLVNHGYMITTSSGHMTSPSGVTDDYHRAEKAQLEMADPELLDKVIAILERSNACTSNDTFIELMDSRSIWTHKIAEIASVMK